MQVGHSSEQRHSYMVYGSIYFWTATIHEWRHLLHPDAFKEVIVSSLQNLSDRGLMDVFAFVLMPNHIHLIWRPLKHNGKETPQGSFLKFTAHRFRRMLLETSVPGAIEPYAVRLEDRRVRFWQDDPMAIRLYSRPVAEQKLHYMHNNPTTERWALAASPADYAFSSARYYLEGDARFPFLKNLWEETWQR